MSDKKRVIQLHYFLLRDKVVDFKDALHIKKHRHTVRKGPDGLGFESVLYIFTKKKTPPAWLPFLQTGFSELEEMQNSHNSAILFVQTKSARFAIPFGYGHTKINLEEVVRDFGRKVVTNTVKADGISSMSLRDFNEISISRTEEASRGTRQELFGVNAEAELLNAIAGVPEDQTLGVRIAGAEGLKLSRSMAFDDLGDICERLRREYDSKAYQKRGFEWVDNLSIVKDKPVIEQLDEMLVQQLKAGATDVQISAPGYFDRENIAYYIYSANSSTQLDRTYLTIEDWHTVHGSKLSKISPETLRKKWFVEAMDGSGNYVQRSSVMDAFVHELQLAGERYVLSSGKWYHVLKPFIKSLDEVVEEISVDTAHLPLAVDGEDEKAYIEELEKRTDLTVFHLKKGKGFKSGRGAVEPCDVYWHDGKFMHLKLWNSSASFSHCLSQGFVSAMTCNRSHDFRRHMVKALGSAPAHVRRPFEKTKFTTSDLTVVFSTIRGTTLDLPFFSKVNLVNAARQVQRMGFQAEYWEIKKKP